MKNESEHYYGLLKARVDYCIENKIDHMDTINDEVFADSLITYCTPQLVTSTDDKGKLIKEYEIDPVEPHDSRCIDRILKIYLYAESNNIRPPKPIRDYMVSVAISGMRNGEEERRTGSQKVIMKPGTYDGIRKFKYNGSGAPREVKSRRKHFPNIPLEQLNDHIIFGYSAELDKFKVENKGKPIYDDELKVEKKPEYNKTFLKFGILKDESDPEDKDQPKRITKADIRKELIQRLIPHFMKRANEPTRKNIRIIIENAVNSYYGDNYSEF